MTKDMINRYQMAIQEYVDLIKENNGRAPAKESKIINQKYRVSTSTSTDIRRAGIVDRIAPNNYVINIHKIEPIHARKVIEQRRSYLKGNTLVTKKVKVKGKKPKLAKLYKDFEDTELLEVPMKKRTISILWGLFKINY